jgi:hypothetical protein
MVLTLSTVVNGQVAVAHSQAEATMEPETPVSGETVQPTAAPVAQTPEAETGTAPPTPSLLMSGISGGCPMMSATMTGDAGSMTGMSGMSGMSGMTDQSSMSGMSSVSNMSGMSGMTNMSSTSSASAMEAARAFQIATGQGLSPYTVNPWWLLGWLVLSVFVLTLIAGLIMAVVLLIKGWRRRQPAQTGA